MEATMKDLWKNMFEKFWFVLAAMILFISPLTAWSVENISIRYLVQGKKVQPPWDRAFCSRSRKLRISIMSATQKWMAWRSN
jgi:hypothetical protein